MSNVKSFGHKRLPVLLYSLFDIITVYRFGDIAEKIAEDYLPVHKLSTFLLHCEYLVICYLEKTGN